MCRTHRCFAIATVVLWGAFFGLAFGVQPTEGPLDRLTNMAGVAAVVLVPYVAFPYLQAEMIHARMQAMITATLIGYELAKEPRDEPKEPTQLHSVG